MGVTNKQPSVKQMFDDLERRIKALETAKRFTIPVIHDWTYCPFNPQSGDMFMDAQTGFVYVYNVDGNTTSTAALNYTTGSATFAVADLRGFKPNQTVAVVNTNKTGYVATVGATGINGSATPVTYQATPVAGNLTVNFITPNVAPTNNSQVTFSATPPANPTTFAAGTTVAAKTWRQLVTASDLIGKTASLTAFGGQGSAVGSNTGGTGENICFGGYTPHQSGSM